ncbi:MAG TPA: BON domain-containing protein [Bryobacteraceae bacterium]|nr:BON domain-containing protein [Bryobacteraceae bacterium]
MKKLIIEGLLVGAAGLMAFAQATTSRSTPAQTGQATTRGSMSDSQMSTQIRQAIMNDTQTQSVAHDIHVSSKNGMVTLKGKVQSEAEKDAAVSHAKQIAGDANVKDDITVAKK